MDICVPEQVNLVFDEVRPHVVLHCAAYTDVDTAQRRPERAMAINAEGTTHVARAAARLESTMLYLSTDYVFDGSSQRPYSEDEAVAPQSHYAISKLLGERRVAQICPRFVIFRTGWLYGSGKGFVDWLKARLASDEPSTVPVVEDQWGSPTWVRHLAAAMLRASESELQGLFHVVNRGSASWYELAERIARRIGGETGVERLRPIAERSLQRAAPRPRYSSLDVSRFERASAERLAAWESALDEYLQSSDPQGC